MDESPTIVSVIRIAQAMSFLRMVLHESRRRHARRHHSWFSKRMRDVLHEPLALTSRRELYKNVEAFADRRIQEDFRQFVHR
jgi:hypothetical protein